MIRKIIYYAIIVSVVQSCFAPVMREYQGTSRALVFTQNKKWLINKVYSDLNTSQREALNNAVLKTFEDLSNGNATSLDEANNKSLIPAKISWSPSLEEIQSLSTTDYDFLVNVYTKKVNDQIANIEIDRPLQYSKNEAFAIIEIYDLKSSKRIYFQKASSLVALDKRQKDYYNYTTTTYDNEKKEGPFLNYNADQLSSKNLKKILKDIEKNAVK